MATKVVQIVDYRATVVVKTRGGIFNRLSQVGSFARRV